jgi:large subunit ribosomal protein L16
MPKRVKYRKAQRGTRRGIATSANEIEFGEFGLQSLENCWLKNTQIEAARVSLTRYTHKGGKVWIRVFPDKPVTKKPAETRMGKGKGMPESWVAVIKRGRVLMEIEGLPEEIAKQAMRLAASKIPFKTKFLSRKR